MTLKNFFGFLLAEGDNLQADWITQVFPIVRYVLVGIILLSAIGIIIAVLLQSDASQGGTNVVSGVRESYYSQNRGESRDGKLKKATIILSSIIGFSMILYFVSLLINAN